MGDQIEYMREELFAKTGIKTEELAEGEYAQRLAEVLSVLTTDCSVSEIWASEVDDASLKQVAGCYVAFFSYDKPRPDLFFGEYYFKDEAKKFYHVKEASPFTTNDTKYMLVTVDKSATFRRSEIEAGLAASQGTPIYVGTKRVNQAICKVGGVLKAVQGIYVKQGGIKKIM